MIAIRQEDSGMVRQAQLRSCSGKRMSDCCQGTELSSVTSDVNRSQTITLVKSTVYMNFEPLPPEGFLDHSPTKRSGPYSSFCSIWISPQSAIPFFRPVWHRIGSSSRNLSPLPLQCSQTASQEIQVPGFSATSHATGHAQPQSVGTVTSEGCKSPGVPKIESVSLWGSWSCAAIRLCPSSESSSRTAWGLVLFHSRRAT